MRGDAERWKRLDEAEVRRQKQKNIDELNNDGYQLYCQCRYGQAAALFSQAASLPQEERKEYSDSSTMLLEPPICCESL